MKPVSKGGQAFQWGAFLPRGIVIMGFLFSVLLFRMPDVAFALSPPAISPSAEDIFFGQLGVGESSEAKMLTITNLGKSDLTITGITIQGANAPDFAQSDDCVNPLPKNGSCTAAVTFTPSPPFEKKRASITITSNDPLHPALKVKLHGDAAPPKIMVKPAAIDFAPVLVGMSIPPRTATIMNLGRSDMSIQSIAIEGPDASAFSQSNDCGNLLPTVTQCTATITVDSSLLAVRRLATLVITSDDPAMPIVRIPISAKIKDHGIFKFLNMDNYNNAGNLLSDNTAVYWSENGQNAINKVPLTDNTPITVARNIGLVSSMALQGQHLYWLDQQYGSGGGCSGMFSRQVLYKTSLDGSSTEILAQGPNCAWSTSDIVVDNEHVYWVEGESVSYPYVNMIRKVPLSGGVSTTIATTQNGLIAITSDSDYIYWQGTDNIWKVSKQGGAPVALLNYSGPFVLGSEGSLALSGADLFFKDSQHIFKVPVSGGEVSTLATVNGALIERLVADGSRVYWTDGASLRSVSSTGDDLAMMADGLKDAKGLTINGDYICWREVTGHHPVYTSWVSGMISCYSKALNTVSVVAQDLNIPGMLAMTDNHIYWTEGGGDPRSGYADGWQRIARASLADGAVSTFATGVYTRLRQPEFTTDPVALADGYLYVGDGYAVKKFSVAGGSGDIIAWTYSKIADIASDGSNVYWFDTLGHLFKSSVNGGEVTELARHPKSGDPHGLLLRNGYLYWHDLDDDEIFEGAIKKISVEGGATVTLVRNISSRFAGFVVDDKYLYFNDTRSQSIRRVSVNGGKSTWIGEWGQLAVDGEFLYAFTCRGSQTFCIYSKLHKDGTVVSTMLIPQAGYGLTVDDHSLYWLGDYNGLWIKTPK